MPTSREPIVTAITGAAATSFSGRRLARGQARAMIWRAGAAGCAPWRSRRVERILDGFGIQPAERERFVEALDRLGYPDWDETENPAYRLFLSGEAAG